MTKTGRAAPAIIVQDMSSRLPAQRLPAKFLDAISCIPIDRWKTDAIPVSNLGGRYMPVLLFYGLQASRQARILHKALHMLRTDGSSIPARADQY